MSPNTTDGANVGNGQGASAAESETFLPKKEGEEDKKDSFEVEVKDSGEGEDRRTLGETG